MLVVRWSCIKATGFSACFVQLLFCWPLLWPHRHSENTSAELDLVGQREQALDQLEPASKVDTAEELDLAPSEESSADCPRRTTSVRRTTPTRRTGVTYIRRPVHFPTQRTVTRYNPPPTSRKIYTGTVDLKPVLAQSAPPLAPAIPVAVQVKPPAPPGDPTQPPGGPTSPPGDEFIEKKSKQLHDQLKELTLRENFKKLGKKTEEMQIKTSEKWDAEKKVKKAEGEVKKQEELLAEKWKDVQWANGKFQEFMKEHPDVGKDPGHMVNPWGIIIPIELSKEQKALRQSCKKIENKLEDAWKWYKLNKRVLEQEKQDLWEKTKDKEKAVKEVNDIRKEIKNLEKEIAALQKPS